MMSVGAQISDQTLRVVEGVMDLPQAVTATGENITYAVASDADFNIDSSTGILSFKNVPDYENAGQREYSVMVTVSTDTGPGTGQATVTVEVGDANDNAPTGLLLGDVNGNPIGNITVDEGDMSVLGTLTAVDEDSVGVYSYTINDNRFAIEGRTVGTGTVYVLRGTEYLDYDASGVSDETTIVQITVNDGVNSEFVGGLVVTVGDVDDEAPDRLWLVNSNGFSVANPVGEENGDNEIGILRGFDIDTSHSFLMFSTSDMRFTIGNDDVLRTSLELDYEDDVLVNGGTTMVTVTVDDGSGNFLVEALTITVMDRDDEFPSDLRLETDTGDRVTNIRAEENGVNRIGILKAEDVDTVQSDLVFSTNDLRFDVELEGG